MAEHSSQQLMRIAQPARESGMARSIPSWKSLLLAMAIPLLLLVAQVGATPLAAQAASASTRPASATPAIHGGQRVVSVTDTGSQRMTNQAQCSTGNQCCPTSLTPNYYYYCQFGEFWPFSGGTLSLSMYIDSGFSSTYQSWIHQAVTNWNNAGTAIQFHIVTYQGANVRMYVAHDGYNCGGVWGSTVDYSDPTYSTKINAAYTYLNVDNSPCDNYIGSTAGGRWISTATHELGHALGLNHNNWLGPNGQQLMNSCGSCASSAMTPQVMDLQLINAMYPQNLLAPLLNVSCGSSWNYHYDDFAFRWNGTSQAGLNTWSTPAISGSSSCHYAEWDVTNPKYTSCVSLGYWVPTYNANVSSLEITIALLPNPDFPPIYRHVYINENTALVSYMALGKYNNVVWVSVQDNQASPAGTTLAVGPVQQSSC